MNGLTISLLGPPRVILDGKPAQFEMLTWELPFVGDSLIAAITAILTQPDPDLARHRPDVPEALADLVSRMLEKERS